MAKRKKEPANNTKSARDEQVASEPAIGMTASGSDPQATQHSPDYWAGYRAGQEELLKSRTVREIEREQREEIERHEAERCISVEFGDSTISVRDGLGRMVKRIPLSGDWTIQLADVLHARGFTVGGERQALVRKVGFSEHAWFTLREKLRALEAVCLCKGAGEGMSVKKNGQEEEFNG